MTKAVLVLAAACLLVAPARAGQSMFVGAAEDDARSIDLAEATAKMELARLAGFDAIRMTSNWRKGQLRPSSRELLALRNAGLAAQMNGIRLILSVYHPGSRTTPRTKRARNAFASYVATIAREVPAITDFIIGNEPNLNLFWMPQYTKKGGNAAASGYYLLLARVYDALKAVSRDINVIGGSISPRGQDKYPAKRHTHSPTTFIPDLGAAYRASKRTKPIMDAFAFHPYLIPSRLPPTFRNPRSTTVALSDYGKLVKLLAKAFDGTAQPGSTLPIVYDEFGYQSVIPPAKEKLYTNLHRPPALDAIPESLQAAYYRQALAIALCQPNVTGMLFFHVSDEEDALRWQSGVYYADDTPKSSLKHVRAATRAARAGSLASCARAKTANPVREVTLPTERWLLPEHSTWSVGITCDRACRYTARLDPLPPVRGDAAASPRAEAATLSAFGTATAGTEQTVTLGTEPLALGTYQYVVRVWAVGKPGTAVVRISDPFSIVEELPPPPPPEPDPEPEPEPTPGLDPPTEPIPPGSPLLPAVPGPPPSTEQPPPPPSVDQLQPLPPPGG